MQQLTRMDEIRAIIGEPKPVTEKKIYQRLNERMVQFIAQSPFMLLSTVDESGFPTISPKGDHAGFVHVNNANQLFIPERKGNKLIYSMQNILQHNQVGLMFIVPGTLEVLRVHGNCKIVKDDALNQRLASKTQHALLALAVEVTEAYFHCGKAMLRSQLWQSDSWPEKLKVSFGQEIAENLQANEDFITELDAGVAERYVTDL